MIRFPTRLWSCVLRSTCFGHDLTGRFDRRGRGRLGASARRSRRVARAVGGEPSEAPMVPCSDLQLGDWLGDEKPE